MWCWNVYPFLNHTGEVFDEIQVDGIYLRQGWCLLIAIAKGKVALQDSECKRGLNPPVSNNDRAI
ncbi:hypothetical protein JOF39_002873 [Glutamicibacter protophormiae]|uniref:Uncharacterized protein n=1 Tax=Glutamicibacter protophormiae TaxID=37930 RepID=A0ABS4XU75_GLUPR|nr:hypothetical protein [Glutamicibacter protophormiae]